MSNSCPSAQKVNCSSEIHLIYLLFLCVSMRTKAELTSALCAVNSESRTPVKRVCGVKNANEPNKYSGGNSLRYSGKVYYNT